MRTASLLLILVLASYTYGNLVCELWPWHKYDPLPTCPSIDIQKFMGEWYEVIRLPSSWENGCYCTTSRYHLNEDGSIRVINTCRKGDVNGKTVVSEALALPEDPTYSKWSVDYGWYKRLPFYIVEIDPDYKWAFIGHPNRCGLWVISRERTLDGEIVRKLLDLAHNYQYDLHNVIWTYQGDQCLTSEVPATTSTSDTSTSTSTSSSSSTSTPTSSSTSTWTPSSTSSSSSSSTTGSSSDTSSTTSTSSSTPSTTRTSTYSTSYTPTSTYTSTYIPNTYTPSSSYTSSSTPSSSYSSSSYSSSSSPSSSYSSSSYSTSSSSYSSNSSSDSTSSSSSSVTDGENSSSYSSSSDTDTLNNV